MSELDSFLKEFDKDLEKMSTVSGSAEPPRYWYSSGNFLLNRIISGSYYNGIPQGRITILAGPSGAGKSFIAANFIASAQKSDAICLVVDSENALDNEFVRKIGVDPTSKKYRYASVTTIPETSKVVSSFLNAYKSKYGTDANAPHAFVLIDSLDMLMTETEQEHYNKGVTKGDQGQRNKQLKAMLRTFVQASKNCNITMVCTSQVYKNQDILNGEGVWIVSDAVKYACSQIILIQKKKLRDKESASVTGNVAGVEMVCEGYKTRFTKPYQRATIEVPYETGMDPLSGIFDVAVELGVVTKYGSWYTMKGETEKYRSGELLKLRSTDIIKQLEALTNSYLTTDVETEEIEQTS